MDQGVDGGGGEEFIGQIIEELGDQNRLLHEHQVVVQAALGVERYQLNGAGVGDLAAGAAGGGNGVNIELQRGFFRVRA